MHFWLNFTNQIMIKFFSLSSKIHMMCVCVMSARATIIVFPFTNFSFRYNYVWLIWSSYQLPFVCEVAWAHDDFHFCLEINACWWAHRRCRWNSARQAKFTSHKDEQDAYEKKNCILLFNSQKNMNKNKIMNRKICFIHKKSNNMGICLHVAVVIGDGNFFPIN